MSIQRHGDGLFWSSLFCIREKEKKQLLKQIKEAADNYERRQLAYEMLVVSEMQGSDYSSDDPCVQEACEHVALKFMLCDTDFAKEFLSDEELEKANEVYARGQYNSKLLKKLLCYFGVLLRYKEYRTPSIGCLFTIPIIDEFRKVQEKEIISSFGDLKKTIEKVASGVKNRCYYEAERFYRLGEMCLDEALNQFVLAKTNYDFNKAIGYAVYNERSTLFCNNEAAVNNSILQLTLVNDADFWSKHEKFSIVAFLNEIVKQNDIRHAEKVLSFIVENMQKMPNVNLMLKNNLPLYMSKYDELVESLEDQAFRFSFKRLESYCDLTKIKAVSLCYPMSKSDPIFFEIGKKVWERFVSEYNYPNDYEAVKSYLENEVNRFISGETHSHYDIAVILDAAPFRYSADNDDRRLFAAYHPDCFSSENIWKRVYLKAYAVTLLSDDEQKQFSYLQRLFVDLIKTIEERIKICTVHQLDIESRDKHYLKLKKMLAAYGIEANDEHKSNYVISLLDRDTALIEEAENFPILEQIGDAVYGLAVAELLFFNPDSLFYPGDRFDSSGKNIVERFERFTRAEAQVLISKKHKIDELYLQTGLPSKYIEFDSIFFDYETTEEVLLQKLNQEKYLADSLEMIIGAIFIDKGMYCALNFAKQLLKETYPKHFNKEVHVEDRKANDENIDWEYWVRILPGPYLDMSDAHRVMWDALNKVVLIASLGTDDKDKRKFITNSFGNTAIYGEKDRDARWPLYYYLHNGLDFVLQKYGNTIRANYTTSNSN